MGLHITFVVSKAATREMKAFILVAFVFALASAKPDFDPCPGFTNEVVNPLHVSIGPDPLVAKKGQPVNIHFDATVVKTLEVGGKIQVKMVKDGIPIPCIPVPGIPIKVGSCTFGGQEILDIMPKEWCEKYSSNGCKLPLQPGFYGDKNPNHHETMVLPDIPAILAPLLKGNLKVEVKVFQPDSTEVVCVQNTLTITA